MQRSFRAHLREKSSGSGRLAKARHLVPLHPRILTSLQSCVESRPRTNNQARCNWITLIMFEHIIKAAARPAHGRVAGQVDGHGRVGERADGQVAHANAARVACRVRRRAWATRSRAPAEVRPSAILKTFFALLSMFERSLTLREHLILPRNLNLLRARFCQSRQFGEVVHPLLPRTRRVSSATCCSYSEQ